MADGIAITSLHVVPTGDADRARGLLGFASFALGPIHLDGVALRRTRDGRLALSVPVRHDRSGRQHAIVRPVDDAARCAIEAQVFAALGFKAEEVAP
jgi:hypothetical protein